MVKKFCSSCFRETWHNPMGKAGTKDGKDSRGLRCSFCGHPVSTNPGKRESQEQIRKKLSAQKP